MNEQDALVITGGLIVFVIDVEGIWIGGPERVGKLKLAILRLLTYYRDRKRRAMWGHTFFNTG